MRIDLTHKIIHGMPVYPGTPEVAVSPLFTLERDGFSETALTLTSQTGTHLDAPAHMIPGGATVADFSLDRISGTACVVFVPQDTGIITREMIDAALQGRTAEFLLFATGHDRYWDTDTYYANYPVPNDEAIQRILSLAPVAVGFDTPGIDPIKSDAYSGHLAVLGAGIFMIENLRNLMQLSPWCVFTCVPLLTEAADGAPVRAFAMVKTISET